MDHVGVDQRIVPHDLAFSQADESLTSHISCKLIDVLEASFYGQGPGTVPGFTQINNQEFISCTLAKTRRNEISPAYPIPVPLEPLHQVASDKTASAAYKRLLQLNASGCATICLDIVWTR